MHIQLRSPNSVFVNRVLVGAPRAVALPLQKANRTGGLYSCDITSRGPCTRIEFDNDGMFICTRSSVPLASLSVPHLSFLGGRKGGTSIYSWREDLLFSSALTVDLLASRIFAF